MTENTVTVAEISSFQLETTHEFKPEISAILNITPDHLNRHHTMECYVETKERIASNQTKEDVCVLNYEDAYTRTFGEKCPAKVVFFSSKRELADGLFLQGEEIMLAENGKVQRLMNIHEMNLVGLCNVENVMAAIAIAAAYGVPMETTVAPINRSGTWNLWAMPVAPSTNQSPPLISRTSPTRNRMMGVIICLSSRNENVSYIEPAV